jgi:hypothetical protein
LISQVAKETHESICSRSFTRFCKGQTIEQLTWTNTPHQKKNVVTKELYTLFDKDRSLVFNVFFMAKLYTKVVNIAN